MPRRCGSPAYSRAGSPPCFVSPDTRGAGAGDEAHNQFTSLFSSECVVTAQVRSPNLDGYRDGGCVRVPMAPDPANLPHYRIRSPPTRRGQAQPLKASPGRRAVIGGPQRGFRPGRAWSVARGARSHARAGPAWVASDIPADDDSHLHARRADDAPGASFGRRSGRLGAAVQAHRTPVATPLVRIVTRLPPGRCAPLTTPRTRSRPATIRRRGASTNDAPAAGGEHGARADTERTARVTRGSGAFAHGGSRARDEVGIRQREELGAVGAAAGGIEWEGA